MGPPAEQVIRDYLDRLTVAARILPPDDRQAFLARYQNLVERRSGVRDMADPADVMRALSAIGQPEALAARERARLDAQREEQEAAAGQAGSGNSSPPAEDGGNGSAGGGQPGSRRPRSIEDLVRKDGRPVTGEIKVTTRPISSRWRPGEPLKPKKSRRGRVPPPPPESARRPGQDGAAAANGAAAASGAAGSAAAETPAPPTPAGTSATSASAAPAGAPAPPGTAASAPAETPPTRAPTRRLPRPARPRLPRRLQPGDLTLDMARRAAETGRQHRRETASVVMLALGGLILPSPLWAIGFLLWLAGALIAGTSKLWSLPDKWIGLVGPAALVIIGTALTVSLEGARSTGSAYLHETLTTAMYLFMVGAVLGAAYLAWRIYRGRRPASIPSWLWRRHT